MNWGWKTVGQLECCKKYNATQMTTQKQRERQCAERTEAAYDDHPPCSGLVQMESTGRISRGQLHAAPKYATYEAVSPIKMETIIYYKKNTNQLIRHFCILMTGWDNTSCDILFCL